MDLRVGDALGQRMAVAVYLPGTIGSFQRLVVAGREVGMASADQFPVVVEAGSLPLRQRGSWRLVITYGKFVTKIMATASCRPDA
jgi:hypothetical protein